MFPNHEYAKMNMETALTKIYYWHENYKRRKHEQRVLDSKHYLTSNSLPFSSHLLCSWSHNFRGTIEETWWILAWNNGFFRWCPSFTLLRAAIMCTFAGARSPTTTLLLILPLNDCQIADNHSLSFQWPFLTGLNHILCDYAVRMSADIIALFSSPSPRVLLLQCKLIIMVTRY